MAEPVHTRWRTGRKVGRTLYLQIGDEPSDSDPIIGLMDSPDLAELVVESVNTVRAAAPEVIRHLVRRVVADALNEGDSRC